MVPRNSERERWRTKGQNAPLVSVKDNKNDCAAVMMVEREIIEKEIKRERDKKGTPNDLQLLPYYWFGPRHAWARLSVATVQQSCVAVLCPSQPRTFCADALSGRRDVAESAGGSDILPLFQVDAREKEPRTPGGARFCSEFHFREIVSFGTHCTRDRWGNGFVYRSATAGRGRDSSTFESHN